MQRDDNEPDANGVQVHMVDTESIYPIATGPFTQDVRTNLPYVSSRRLLNLERPWDGVLMDDERVVGFTRSALHILPTTLAFCQGRQIPRYLLHCVTL